MTSRTEDLGLTKPNTAAGRAVATLLATVYETGEFGRGNAQRAADLANEDVAAIEAEASAEPRRLLAALVEHWTDPVDDPLVPYLVPVETLRAARRYLADDR